MFYRYHSDRSKLLVTAAVGDEYFGKWKKNSLPNWTAYADRYGFGIIALRFSLVGEESHLGWNKFKLVKFLEAETSAEKHLVILDADQILSPLAPDLSGWFGTSKLGVVPENYGRFQRLLSYLRRAHLDATYPLDSYLLRDPDIDLANGQMNELSSLDFFSAGLIVVPSSERGELSAFSEYGPNDPASAVDGGGDQIPFLKYLNGRDIQLLPAEWQGIWPQIMATRYPFLYSSKDLGLAGFALASALTEFHCIHFSTTWPEKQFWDVSFEDEWNIMFPELPGSPDLKKYMDSRISPKFYGQIQPPSRFF